MLSRFFVFAVMSIVSAAGSQAQTTKSGGQWEKQAEVMFVNKTGLNLRVKVMSVSASRLCAAVDVLPYDTALVRIAHGGRYVAKARAMMDGGAVCIRTGSIQLQCDAQGYTQAEMTFSEATSVTDSDGNAVERTLSARVTGFRVISRIAADDGFVHGSRISEREFDKD